MPKGKPTKVPRVCIQCRTLFLARQSFIACGGGLYCSKSCYHQSRIVPLIDRFFRYVGRKQAGGCIPWTGCTNKDGYGVIGTGTRAGRMVIASRVSYEHFVGPIPDGLFVLHRCDNPPCINPVHLFLGTKAANAADMATKGRGRKRVPGSRRYLKEQRS